jgi:hypothetical protein
MTKDKATRKVNTTSQSTSSTSSRKKNETKHINELQIQDSTVLDEEVEIPPSSKTPMVCRLAQVPPDICNSLSSDPKKWLLNERKSQKQEDDKLNKSYNSAQMLK